MRDIRKIHQSLLKLSIISIYGWMEMFYLTMHSTHFIYSYMASDIWLRTILIVTKETRGHHIGYSFQLTAKVLFYAPSHRQDSTYHSLCYTRLEREIAQWVHYKYIQLQTVSTQHYLDFRLLVSSFSFGLLQTKRIEIKTPCQCFCQTEGPQLLKKLYIFN